jgi:hypothetical protein
MEYQNLDTNDMQTTSKIVLLLVQTERKKENFLFHHEWTKQE